MLKRNFKPLKMQLKHKNVFYIALDGVAAIAAFNIFQPFVQMFGKHLGASDFQIALINSLPALASIFVLIPGAYFIESARSKKSITIKLVFMTSLFYVLISLVPFIDSNVKSWIYVILIGLMSVPSSIFNTSWQSFFSDVFKGKVRNYAFAIRNKYATLIGLITTLLAGQILTNLPKTDTQRIYVYQAFSILAFLFLMMEIHFLSKIDSPPSKPDNAEKPTLPKWADIKSNKRFLIYTITSFIYYVSWQMGWPLFFFYQVDFLHANELWLAIINVAGAITSVLSFTMWNRIISKYGNSFVLIIAAAGIAINPILFVTAHSLITLTIINAFIGIFGAALTLTLFNNLLEVVPDKSKTMYIAYYNTLMGISGFASPIIGEWLYKITNIYFAMNFIGILRFIGTYIFYLRYKREKISRDKK